MTKTTQTQRATLEHAERLLREAAAELMEGISINGLPDWEGEPDTATAYQEHCVAADGLAALIALQAEPVALIEGVDEYGPRLHWHKHWVDVGAGARLYAAAPPPDALSDVWMPIETAPKNGRVLLLGYYNAHNNWRTLRGEWVSEDEIAEYWENNDAEPGWYETAVEAEDQPNAWPTNPTHWRPLPAPPTINASGEVRNG